MESSHNNRGGVERKLAVELVLQALLRLAVLEDGPKAHGARCKLEQHSLLTWNVKAVAERTKVPEMLSMPGTQGNLKTIFTTGKSFLQRKATK